MHGWNVLYSLIRKQKRQHEHSHVCKWKMCIHSHTYMYTSIYAYTQSTELILHSAINTRILVFQMARLYISCMEQCVLGEHRYCHLVISFASECTVKLSWFCIEEYNLMLWIANWSKEETSFPLETSFPQKNGTQSKVHVTGCVIDNTI